ncbi:MAG: hypothetical protein HQ503_10180 [Rhodospirillales bacterium]|nr:hypothetical protein [Rhodospirillales bacterium]
MFRQKIQEPGGGKTIAHGRTFEPLGAPEDGHSRQNQPKLNPSLVSPAAAIALFGA